MHLLQKHKTKDNEDFAGYSCNETNSRVEKRGHVQENTLDKI
jgi:hypothetical protein